MTKPKHKFTITDRDLESIKFARECAFEAGYRAAIYDAKKVMDRFGYIYIDDLKNAARLRARKAKKKGK